jgi:release factor glutamine methyltransferase
MRIPSNHVKSVVNYFYSELKDEFGKDDIETLLFYCCETYLGFRSRTELTLRAEETMSESDLLKFNFAVKDLKKHRPIQYILGETMFLGLTFSVNEEVLIPRPETEELVDLIIRENKGRTLRILDIGTGSGCIAISLKKNLPESQVTGVDISEGALALARNNAEANRVAVPFIQLDILNIFPLPIAEKLDIIVSNPPYVTSSEKKGMESNVLNYEPHLALFVPNEDPLLFYRKIIEVSVVYLNSGGRIYFEINKEKGKEITELLRLSGFDEITVKKDMQGMDRIISARKD